MGTRYRFRNLQLFHLFNTVTRSNFWRIKPVKLSRIHPKHINPPQTSFWDYQNHHKLSSTSFLSIFPNWLRARSARFPATRILPSSYESSCSRTCNKEIPRERKQHRAPRVWLAAESFSVLLHNHPTVCAPPLSSFFPDTPIPRGATSCRTGIPPDTQNGWLENFIS